MTENIDDVLGARKKTHGEYSDHARVTQSIMRVLMGEPTWDGLPDIVKETLHMDAHKTGRVVTGNPFLHDHYVDKMGYCKLIVERTIDGVGLKPEHDPMLWRRKSYVMTGAARARQVKNSLLADFVDPAVGQNPSFQLGPDPVNQAETENGEPMRGLGLGAEILTEERLQRAISHAINYHGLESKLGDQPDYKIAGQLMPEIAKYLRGETDVQVVDVIQRCLKRRAEYEALGTEGYDLHTDVARSLNMRRPDAKKLVFRYLYGEEYLGPGTPEDGGQHAEESAIQIKVDEDRAEMARQLEETPYDRKVGILNAAREAVRALVTLLPKASTASYAADLLDHVEIPMSARDMQLAAERQSDLRRTRRAERVAELRDEIDGLVSEIEEERRVPRR